MDPVSLVLVAILAGAAIASWKAWPIGALVAIGLAAAVSMSWLEPAWLLVLPAIVVVLIAWPLVRYGLVAHRKRVAPDSDVFERRDATHRSTEAIDKYFHRQSLALAAAGFQQHNDVVEVARNDERDTESLTFLRLFTNPETRVTITCAVFRHRDLVLEHPPYINCTTRLANGRIIITSNARNPDPYPAPPQEDRVCLPSFVEAVALIEAHRIHVRHAGQAPAELPPPTDWIGDIRAHRKRWYSHQVTFGIMTGAGQDEFRLTIRGALLYVVFTHPFLSSIQQRIVHTRERAAIARLGLTSAARPKQTLLQTLRSWELPALAMFLVLGTCYSMRADDVDGSFETRGASIRIPSNLVVPDSFAGAVSLLENLTGKRASTLLTHPDVDTTGMDILAIPLPPADAKLLAQQAQPAFAAKGFLVFHTMHHGDQYRIGEDAIAIAPYNDPYRVMQRVHTNGDNFRISTDSVIAWFRETQRELPLRFTSISFDFVGAIWDGEVRDPTNFGRRFLEFCPELRDSARRAGQALARDQYLFCWWD